MESSTWLIANPATWENAWSREKISRFAVLLEGAIAGLGKVGLKMNVPQEQLRAVLDVLPALKEPTVSHLSREGWCAVETVLDEREARELIPRIKEAGGEGIVEYPLNKVIP